MDSTKPFMLVRARIKSDEDGSFGAWFRSVHLKDVARIPGVVDVDFGTTHAGTWLGIYSFGDASAAQQALSSPEAAYARGTWDQWAGELEELQVEIMSPLAPLSLYQSRC
ncbi:MAG TPA: hypothetical protein QGF35_02095 [Dehalococcoidia bacterium]|jgi:hypothetical protein|nr:hypothetical protein [Dehalococcoidia bacterium]